MQRGFDPREFTLLSFGGAGGLHVCALAERLRMTQAMVPRYGGVLSALGLLVAPQVRQCSHTRIQRIEKTDISELTNEYIKMEQRLVDEMQVNHTELMLEKSVDLRYEGQSSTLNLPWNKDLMALAKSFHVAHQKQFGHALDIAVELVTVRLRAELRSEPPDFSVACPSQPGQPHTFMSIVGEKKSVPVYARKNLALKQILKGPAIITESVSTTWLASGWRAINDTAGNLLLRADHAPE